MNNFLNDIYKVIKITINNIDNIIPNIKDNNLQQIILHQQEQTKEICNELTDIISILEEPSKITKVIESTKIRLNIINNPTNINIINLIISNYNKTLLEINTLIMCNPSIKRKTTIIIKKITSNIKDNILILSNYK